jgi:hypothetical protein
MDEFVADSAPGPAAAEHGFIAIQPLLADFALSRLNREQHRLPLTAGFSDAHGGRSITGPSTELQGALSGLSPSTCRTYLIP